jgi:disulfide bond formation protein DsbB
MNTNPNQIPQPLPVATSAAVGASDPAHERFAVLVSIGLSAAAIVGMVGLAAVIGWTQRQIQLDAHAGTTLTLFDSSRVIHGREMFATACIACHGEDGRGKPGLGKDLTASAYVRTNADGLLKAMIKEGRPADHPLNTTKVMMPPKGGNDKLTDGDIDDIVLYVRALQDPKQVARNVSLIAKAPAPSEAETAAAADAAMAAAGGDAELAAWIASGTKLYASSCIACHGPGGAGIKGNGKALVANEFIQSLDDDALLAFIQKGRDPGDPKNTTGVGMPARGGNPALSEDDILDIISYLRTLQPAADAGASASSAAK